MRYFILVLISAFIINISTPVVAGPLERGIKAYEAKDMDKAVKILQPLAEKGNIEAQHYMGNITRLLAGSVPEAERAPYYQTATHWYNKAQMGGHGEAAWNLGLMYEMGMGVPKNQDAANELYLKAAQKGYEEAYFYAGEIYENQQGGRQSGHYRRDLALNYYKKAAALGHEEAAKRMAGITNAEQAIFDELKAKADGGDADAMMKLGWRYTVNNPPVDADYDLAEKYFLKAYSAGRDDALVPIAKLHAGDSPGFENKDPEVAVYIAAYLIESGDARSVNVIAKEFAYSAFHRSRDDELRARLYAIGLFEMAEQEGLKYDEIAQKRAREKADIIFAEMDSEYIAAEKEQARLEAVRANAEFQRRLDAIGQPRCTDTYVRTYRDGRDYKVMRCRN